VNNVRSVEEEDGEVTNREYFFDLRGRLLAGIISMDDAEWEAGPRIREMNKRASEIAKKHGKKFGGFFFAALVR
jgi:hypothetical protein